jgi:hypothetical protein
MLKYKHLNVYWFTEMESELLFIGSQKLDQRFCLLVYRNEIRAFVYWFTEMRSELLFIGIQK